MGDNKGGFLSGKLGDILKKSPKILGKVASGVVQVASGQNPVSVVRSKLQKDIKSDTNLSDSEKELALKELDNELEQARLEVRDRMDARKMTGSSKKLQFWFAIGFMAAYVSMIIAIIVMLWQFATAELSIGEFGITLIASLAGQMSTKVNTIVDFLFGSSSEKEEQTNKFLSNIERKFST